MVSNILMETSIRTKVANQSESPFKAYSELMKLPIVILLVFTTVTAMVVAANGLPKLDIFLATILGGICAAGACRIYALR